MVVWLWWWWWCECLWNRFPIDGIISTSTITTTVVAVFLLSLFTILSSQQRKQPPPSSPRLSPVPVDHHHYCYISDPPQPPRKPSQRQRRRRRTVHWYNFVGRIVTTTTISIIVMTLLMSYSGASSTSRRISANVFGTTVTTAMTRPIAAAGVVATTTIIATASRRTTTGLSLSLSSSVSAFSVLRPRRQRRPFITTTQTTTTSTIPTTTSTTLSMLDWQHHRYMSNNNHLHNHDHHSPNNNICRQWINTMSRSFSPPSSSFHTTVRRFSTSLDSSFESSSSRHANTKMNPQKMTKSIAIIGGGASGIFAAIHASTTATAASSSSRNTDDRNKYDIKVTVLEATSQVLQKVKISGGGRCNVLHDATIPTEVLLQKGYPRGMKELRSVCVSQYPITKAEEWFVQHNVSLKTEPDGRMFPTTDSSQTVIDALLHTAVQQNHVTILYRTKVLQIIPPTISTASTSTTSPNKHNKNSNMDTKFQVICTKRPDPTTPPPPPDQQPQQVTLWFDAVIVATGSAPAGYALVADATESLSKNRRDTDPAATTTTPLHESNTSISTSTAATAATSIATTTIHHPMVSTVPSLFTFNCKHAVVNHHDTNTDGSTNGYGLLAGLSGVSVPKVRVTYTPPQVSSSSSSSSSFSSTTTAVEVATTKKKKSKKTPAHLIQEGPLLITHLGLSGPAILRLSAFGAREMALHRYRGMITIHWLPDLFHTSEECFDALWTTTVSNPKKTIASHCPLLLPSTTTTTSATTAIPKRLWQSLVRSCDISETLCWGNVNKSLIRKLSEQLLSCSIEMTSKSTNKEEFVTAGGIDLSHVQMKTMESKRISGLFFCGEVLNIDGITGGFNFYNCWSTGYVAGTSAAAHVVVSSSSQH